VNSALENAGKIATAISVALLTLSVIYEWGYFHVIERINARVEADPGLMRRRRCAAEHPRFLTRGLNKVKAETALSVLAYNILRAINLVGASGLRASLA
jgi:hypothetical protein